ncbi:hypothetical protein, partial [Flavobacterium weaverense]|uniref:hypothetical protein n=1 Tax=Flavobacterium weaverense TaxID=271156 RepID=UPI0039F03BAA
ILIQAFYKTTKKLSTFKSLALSYKMKLNSKILLNRKYDFNIHRRLLIYFKIGKIIAPFSIL